MGVCLICLAWAALWLRSPYGRVLDMFGIGRLMAATPDDQQQGCLKVTFVSYFPWAQKVTFESWP